MEPTWRDDLAREHLVLVERIVASMRRRFMNQVESDELRSYAMEGLASAISRYEPERKISFKTFAYPRIRGAVYDGVSRADWLPRRLRRQITFFRKADDMLHSHSENPLPADTTETVHRLGNTLKELATAYLTSYAAAIDNEPVSTPPQAEEAIERKRYRVMLKAQIDTLPQKQAFVLNSYFFEEMSLPEIAAKLDRSKSWTSRLLTRGLTHLREAMTK